MKKMLIILILFSRFINIAIADQYVVEPKNVDTVYHFGPITIVQNFNSQKSDNPQLMYSLSIYKENRLINRYLNKGFDEIFASEGNKYFIGVSNSGLLPLRYIILDDSGNIIKESEGSDLQYCKMSISVVRQWYYHSNPRVKFLIKEDKLEDVQINTCQDRIISLLKSSY